MFFLRCQKAFNFFPDKNNDCRSLGWMGCGAAINGLELARSWTQIDQQQQQQLGTLSLTTAKSFSTESNDVLINTSPLSLHLAIDLPSVHLSFPEDNEVQTLIGQ